MNFAWYKYREHTSSSTGKWQYIVILDDGQRCHKRIAYYLDRRGLLSTWSEHFRQVEIKKVKTAPAKDVLGRKKEVERELSDLTSELIWLNGQNIN